MPADREKEAREALRLYSEGHLLALESDLALVFGHKGWLDQPAMVKLLQEDRAFRQISAERGGRR